MLTDDAWAKPTNTCGGGRWRGQTEHSLSAVPTAGPRSQRSRGGDRRRSRAEAGGERGEADETIGGLSRARPEAAARKPGDRERAASRGGEENLEHGISSMVWLISQRAVADAGPPFHSSSRRRADDISSSGAPSGRPRRTSPADGAGDHSIHVEDLDPHIHQVPSHFVHHRPEYHDQRSPQYHPRSPSRSPSKDVAEASCAASSSMAQRKEAARVGPIARQLRAGAHFEAMRMGRGP